ncbi:hypothetical protein P691DRAFT_768919 [Macrolepiota fuliginosa MF-IS2]|uniref:Uncharacterized protein n=1 Tax=Macrolepiota fuliginosa MF-IS2 TaxID=1400762 RepID=A0A9P5WXY9_9AGAR|nr:hypothetical protein P691DRAFT_768919 [Macrolepiota fuliginosa MF-IS2]
MAIRSSPPNVVPPAPPAQHHPSCPTSSLLPSPFPSCHHLVTTPDDLLPNTVLLTPPHLLLGGIGVFQLSSLHPSALKRGLPSLPTQSAS